MNNIVCVTCGTQFSETDRLPQRGPICEDERQVVNFPKCSHGALSPCFPNAPTERGGSTFE